MRIIKRLALLLAITLFAVAVRLYDNGLLSFVSSGQYSIFDESDNVTIFDERPTFGARSGYERIDATGSYADASALLKKMNADIVKYEKVDDIIIIYAFTDRIEKKEKVFGRNVNVMIALSQGNMVVGSPLIKGSY